MMIAPQRTQRVISNETIGFHLSLSVPSVSEQLGQLTAFPSRPLWCKKGFYYV